MRYALFGGPIYYPSGGWEDFVDVYDDVNEAVEEAHRRFNEPLMWWQVVNIDTRTVVCRQRRTGESS